MWNFDLPNWITAVATVATAIIAYLGFWRTRVRPVIETNELLWNTSPEQLQYLELRVAVRNPLWETLIIRSVCVKRPKKSTFAVLGGPIPYDPIIQATELHKLKLNWEIGAIGELYENAPSRYAPSNILYRSIYIIPPPDWLGGEVKIIFCLSSMASTMRDKRIVIRKHVKAAAKRITDDTASNHD